MVLPEQAVILLVEDRLDDVTLIERAFSNAGVRNPFFVVRDGEEAMAYLYGNGKYANRAEFPLPDIMLLDLKMPKMDGFEVLYEVRKDKNFAALRIIVLTSSEEISDVNRAYDLGANSFLVKPLEFENFTSMMRTLSAFWLRQSRAPVIERPPRKKESNGRSTSGSDSSN